VCGKRPKPWPALALYTYDGLVLGYPWTLTTGQVFFNQNLFKAAGRATPDELYKQERWSWPAMTEAAVALTRRTADGKIEQLGIAQQSIWRLALNSNGTDLFDDFRRPKKSRSLATRRRSTSSRTSTTATTRRDGWTPPRPATGTEPARASTPRCGATGCTASRS
jgi:hypothetical protein